MRRMIRTLALFLSLTLAWLTAGATAQQRSAAAAPAPLANPATVTARPALWKIADKDTTIYLFGTIHALRPGVVWMDGPIESAFKASDELVTEIPETAAADMQAAVMASAMLPPGKTLRELLNPDDRAKLEQALAGFGLPAETFDRFEPWYAAVALTAFPLAKQGYSAENGVEQTFSIAAKRHGHARIGLETAAYQLAIFDSLPLDVQKSYLHEVIEGLPTLDQDLAGMVREWSAGNPDKLAELLNADEDDPRMVAALLTNRNRAWAQWITARMKQPGKVFMAVGAGHLAGKDSVQAMLASSGIMAVRVQ